jgi:23S rRNA (pseudouridine1915-N3)-methyltransferase
MKLTVLAIGKLKSGPERDLAERSRGRAEALGRAAGFAPLEVIEVAESRARREDDRRAQEGRVLVERAGADLLVALDQCGQSITSEALAQRLAGWRDQGAGAAVFAIGGADGLDAAVRCKAALVLSFGALTIPHQIVRVLLLEQIYRCLTIIAGHPYHRGG